MLTHVIAHSQNDRKLITFQEHNDYGRQMSETFISSTRPKFAILRQSQREVGKPTLLVFRRGWAYCPQLCQKECKMDPLLS